MIEVKVRRPLVRKSDVLALFNGVERQAALALNVTAQAANRWGTYLPELTAWRALETFPQLRQRVRWAKPKKHSPRTRQ